MEPNNKLSTELNQKSLDPISFFSENNYFVLAYKKTEKLASAVYMVTGLLSDSEPMKWTLRKKVGELLSLILTYKDVPEVSLSDCVDNVKTRTLELTSLLEISFRGGFISQMNFSILKQEFLNLVEVFDISNSFVQELSSGTLSKEFFEVPKDSFNRKAELSERPNPMSFSPIKDNGLDINRNNYKKSNRHGVILNLLKKKKELTIKDIALVITDCGEKTIQRELNSLISTGLLKRSGVRRWSRYSLA